MNTKLSKLDVPNVLSLLRKAGYSPFTDPKTGQDSYILRLTADYYPRFHLYVKENPTKIELSLHIDQKKPGYKGASRHNAEYDGSVVENEMKRIIRWAAQMCGKTADEILNKKEVSIDKKNQDNPKKKSTLFGGIF